MAAFKANDIIYTLNLSSKQLFWHCCHVASSLKKKKKGQQIESHLNLFCANSDPLINY